MLNPILEKKLCEVAKSTSCRLTGVKAEQLTPETIHYLTQLHTKLSVIMKEKVFWSNRDIPEMSTSYGLPVKENDR